MPRSRPPYSPVFRAEMVRLVRAGRTPEELAREFEPSAQAIRTWVQQADERGESGRTICASGVGQRAAKPTWSHPCEAVRLFLGGATARTGWKVSAVVGTVLSAVNQGAVISGGDATWATWVRVGVNYLVPFLVASVGFLSACREREGPT